MCRFVVLGSCILVLRGGVLGLALLVSNLVWTGRRYTRSPRSTLLRCRPTMPSDAKNQPCIAVCVLRAFTDTYICFFCETSVGLHKMAQFFAGVIANLKNKAGYARGAVGRYWRGGAAEEEIEVGPEEEIEFGPEEEEARDLPFACVVLETTKIDFRVYERPHVKTRFAEWPTITEIWVVKKARGVIPLPQRMGLEDFLQFVYNYDDAIYVYNASRFVVPCIHANLLKHGLADDYAKITDYANWNKFVCAMHGIKPLLYYSEDAKYPTLDDAFDESCSMEVEHAINVQFRANFSGSPQERASKLCVIAERIHRTL